MSLQRPQGVYSNRYNLERTSECSFIIIMSMVQQANHHVPLLHVQAVKCTPARMPACSYQISSWQLTPTHP